MNELIADAKKVMMMSNKTFNNIKKCIEFVVASYVPRLLECRSSISATFNVFEFISRLIYISAKLIMQNAVIQKFKII